MYVKYKKGKCYEVGPWRPHKLRLFSPLLTPLFHEHSRRVFRVLLYAISESCDTDFAGQIVYKPRPSYSMLSQSLVTQTSLARLFINPEFCQCPLRRSCQLQLFWYLQQTACFCCISAGNWDGYRTFNVMVLKCVHYTIRITLNVLQTGCTVASKLGFEPCSLVWRTSSLPIKPRAGYLYMIPSFI